MIYRSTTLNYLTRYCPHALDMYESGKPYDREIFAAGIAAHAVLQMVGEAVRGSGEQTPELVRGVADAVARELVTNGREFEGNPEPPMSPDAATAGRRIAENWLAQNALSPAARYEHGLAVDKNWNPCDWNAPEAYYRAALDVIEVVEGEDDDGYPTTTVITRDYKSSWQATRDELDTIQIHGQAALAAAYYPEATAIVREVVNLRTHAVYSDATMMNEDGAATMAGWRRDIDVLIAAAEHRPRVARCGTHCAGCPYVLRCETARRNVFSSADLMDADMHELAVRLAAMKAYIPSIEAILKSATEESGIAIDGGYVGYNAVSSRVMSESAPEILCKGWTGEKNELVEGLIRVLSPGTRAIESIARQMIPVKSSDDWKQRRADMMESCLKNEVRSTFGVWNKEK